MKTPSGTYFEVSELKRRVFVVVGPNFVSPSLNGGGGLKFNPTNQPTFQTSKSTTQGTMKRRIQDSEHSSFH